MTTSGEISAAPPDWATIHWEILCPLCEYNLRGLVEPRCPECGYRFEWREILEQSQGEYTWLFEYARKRKFISFLRTFLSSQLPQKFWRSVRPVAKPKVGRLIIYWLLLSCVIGVPVLVMRSTGLIRYYVSFPRMRQALEKGAAFNLRREDPLGDPQLQAAEAHREAVREYPLIPYRWQLNDLLDENDIAKALWDLSPLVIGAALWPWLTLLSLLLFQRSLRMASIKASHVLRCAIYASDSTFVLVIPVAWVLNWCIGVDINVRRSGFLVVPRTVFFAEWRAMPVFLGIGLLFTYRLNAAYRNYLSGFPHALATCAASQLIVLLTLLCLAPWGWIL